ncbi:MULTISPECIES: hypothetical protein [Rhodococcus]|jgi:hypothetical protein|uniref:hypothetical protein n=1 Tax=Rhodococcus TaxID=1827 RepID=UPI0002A40D9B|nr:MULTISPECIES: hypothetical protein [Rhodococcus]ELB95047.1 hypothetical protein Rwratislav_00515 [Rhodococcus wratislaviensis IFP 2016]MBC2644957.1 hypothetical protein [Rhodococcus sp. 3A]MBC2898032.1 hypothetical protein [Rhodococcus sp. 4CII]MBO8150698.1 hypothetical protein [Rhodococcus erythropolis]QTJ70876.1 hypothetical protein HYG77_35695 [Rhodococcus sp. ZPP]
MSIALTLAVSSKFDNAMTHCDNLIEVHNRAGSGGRGRRTAETSVNRAVVVIAIASWQAVVQDMARFLVEHHMPQPTDPGYGVAKLIRGQVFGEIGNFSTPNAQNTRNLLISAGFDPRNYWTWTTRGQNRQMLTLRPHEVEDRLRKWLMIRHAIAHGDEAMPDVDVLQAVKQNAVRPGQGPAIRLEDAKQCIAFIRKLTDVTLGGIKAEL